MKNYYKQLYTHKLEHLDKMNTKGKNYRVT